MVTLPTMFLLLRVAWAICDPILIFGLVFFSRSVRCGIRILIGIALNPHINFGRAAIPTLLSLPIQDRGWSSHQ